MVDCQNCTPKDYRIHRLEEDFAKHQIERRSNFPGNYLKMAFYPQLKKAIEKHSLNELKSLTAKIVQMGFHLKDLPSHSTLQDYIQGERYIPLLFLALEHRSYTCFRQLGVPLIAQLDLSKSSITDDSFWKGHLSSSTEELQSLNLVETMKTCEDEDHQWKPIFQQCQTTMIPVDESSEKKMLSKKDKFIRMISSFHISEYHKCVLL